MTKITLGDIDETTFDRIRARLDFLTEDSGHFHDRVEGMVDMSTKVFQEVTDGAFIDFLNGLWSRAAALMDDIEGIRAIFDEAIENVDDGYQPRLRYDLSDVSHLPPGEHKVSFSIDADTVKLMPIEDRAGYNAEGELIDSIRSIPHYDDYQP